MAQNKKLQIEFVTYYKVFDLNLMQISKTRWVATALPIAACSGLSYGDSVVVSFSVNGDDLVPSKVNKTISEIKPPLSLIGEFIGVHSDDSLCLVGFPLHVSQIEFESTEYTKGLTLIVNAVFSTNSDSDLVFNSLVVVDRQAKNPIRFK